MPFFGLSMDEWNAGFSTQREVFEWIASSRFFATGRPFTRQDMQRDARERRIKDDRKMYWEFLEWAAEREQEMGLAVTRESFDDKTFHAEALDYFNKRAQFDALVESRVKKQIVKSKFNAAMVAEWTGLNVRSRGKDVKRIMDAVRETFGGSEGVVEAVEEEGNEQVEKVVLEVWDKIKAEDQLKRSSNE
jgi:hypothetical protein